MKKPVPKTIPLPGERKRLGLASQAKFLEKRLKVARSQAEREKLSRILAGNRRKFFQVHLANKAAVARAIANQRHRK